MMALVFVSKSDKLPDNVLDPEDAFRNDLWASIRAEIRTKEFWQPLVGAAIVCLGLWLLMQVDSRL